MDSVETTWIPLLGMVALLFLLACSLTFVELARWSRAGSDTDTNASRRITLRDTPADHAEALLRDVLDAQEYEQLTKHAYFDVKSPTNPDRVYRIPGYLGLVRVYEHGLAVQDICIQPVDPVPSADVIAMHKLMIQGDEQAYLARARKYIIT